MAVTDFGYKLIAKPNNSMSPRDTLMLVMGLATLSFVIAIAFARIGAWLVLPFAGLEILAISYAFYYIQRGSTNPEFTHSVYPYIWNDTFGVRTNVENIVSFKEPEAQYAWVSGPVQTDALTYVYFFPPIISRTININITLGKQTPMVSTEIWKK